MQKLLFGYGNSSGRALGKTALAENALVRVHGVGLAILHLEYALRADIGALAVAITL
jgi:hypothetical protein